MRYLSLAEVVALHQAVLEQSGGTPGIRDLSLLESALAQPMAAFGGLDLHPTLTAKAAALCFSLPNETRRIASRRLDAAAQPRARRRTALRF